MLCREMACGDSWRKGSLDGLDADMATRCTWTLEAQSSMAQYTPTPKQVPFCSVLCCAVLCCAVLCCAVLLDLVRWTHNQALSFDFNIACKALTAYEHRFMLRCITWLNRQLVVVDRAIKAHVRRGLRPQANAKGQNSVSSDLRCMSLSGWRKGNSQQGSSPQGRQQANIITASSDATMSLVQFDLHTCRSVRTFKWKRCFTVGLCWSL